MGTFFKKDVLVFWRDRKEILMALLLPIVIILILNIAFSGLFNGDTEAITLDVAVVSEDAGGLEQFEKTVEGMKLSQEEKQAILEQASQINPVGLIENFLQSPEMKEIIKIHDVTETKAKELVRDGELDALIKIPSGFINEVLSQAFLGEQSKLKLVIQAEEESSEVKVLQDIIYNFTDTINLQFALGDLADSAITEVELPQGGREIADDVETFTMTQYFTIAISTLFALFVAQTVSINTVTEKRERVFNRIILSNNNPLNFLIGKALATFCLSWLQLMIIIMLTQLIVNAFSGKTFEFWAGFIIIITAYALAVAGLSIIFTILTLNMQDANAVNGLTTLVLMIMGFLGGSFFPLQGLPEFMQKIGVWTPNGLTQITLVKWIQYSDFQDLIIPLLAYGLFFIVCLIIGIAIFPRRGRI